MKDNYSSMNDLTRLYQLYIMTDKILSQELNSYSGINYETLKKFKSMSMRINYLHMQESLKRLNELEYETKDIYEEQQRLNEKVKTMEDVSDARNILINKYRKYSALPLVLDDIINLDDLDYLSDKLNYINEYIKNETYLSKLDNSLSNLGISLGNKTKELEESLEFMPIYEKELKTFLLNNKSTNETLHNIGFDIKELNINDKEFLSKYDEINSIYNEVKDKFDAMNLVDKSNYSDVIREISDEYRIAKVNKYIVEILKIIFTEEKEYDAFYEKRINIRTYLMDLFDNIFGREFINLLNKQIEKCEKITTIRKEVDEIRDEINKNNSLASRIRNNQKELEEKIYKKKEYISESELPNQVLSIKSSTISYSKPRVNQVLKYVFDTLNTKEENHDNAIFVDENKPFEENNDNNELFTTTIEPFNKSNAKMEANDDIFENVTDKENIFDSSNEKDKEDIFIPFADKWDDNNPEDIKLYNFSNNIFNDSINPEIVGSNIQFINPDGTFWPNIG